MEDESMARINDLLEEYKNLKRTAAGLIYFVAIPTGKQFRIRIDEIRRHYEMPKSSSVVDPHHISTLEAILPTAIKDIQQLREERNL
jgi:hypothetical protein